MLDGQLVGYAFTRARRRSIGMTVGPEGLAVRAPRWVSLREVEAALQERAAWIVRHLVQQRQRAEAQRGLEDAWRDGGTLQLLGVPVTLSVDPDVLGCRPCWVDAPGLEHIPPPVGAVLRVGLGVAGGRRARRIEVAGEALDTAAARRDAIREAVHAWLQRRAATLFEQRCALYAPALGVQVRSLGLSAARTRWGSAGIDGSVRLNWRLIHHTMPCIDYVVVHELAHLRHMNHGPAFWALVASVVPDHRALRRQLRDALHDEGRPSKGADEA